MAKYNLTAIMSLQLLAIATVILCVMASAAEEQVSSSKYAKWAENNKMAAEHVKLSTSEDQIKSAAAAEEQVSSSKFAKWAENNKMTERVKLSTSAEQIKPAAAAEEQVSSSKYAKWAENNKMAAEHVKLSTSEEQIKSAAEEKHNKASCAAPSSSKEAEEEEEKCQKSASENGKSKTNFRPKAEELANLNDNQLREAAASLMEQKDAPIAFHDHAKHKCWKKCAFEKVKPYCDRLIVSSNMQGCLLAGGKACALYCSGGSLN